MVKRTKYGRRPKSRSIRSIGRGFVITRKGTRALSGYDSLMLRSERKWVVPLYEDGGGRLVSMYM